MQESFEMQLVVRKWDARVQPTWEFRGGCSAKPANQRRSHYCGRVVDAAIWRQRDAIFESVLAKYAQIERLLPNSLSDFSIDFAVLRSSAASESLRKVRLAHKRRRSRPPGYKIRGRRSDGQCCRGGEPLCPDSGHCVFVGRTR